MDDHGIIEFLSFDKLWSYIISSFMSSSSSYDCRSMENGNKKNSHNKYCDLIFHCCNKHSFRWKLTGDLGYLLSQIIDHSLSNKCIKKKGNDYLLNDTMLIFSTFGNYKHCINAS